MSNPVIEELKTLRDEVRVQAHLFSMELKEKFNNVEKKLAQLEDKAETKIEAFGEKNEHFWVGNKEEVNSLLEEYKRIKEEM